MDFIPLPIFSHETVEYKYDNNNDSKINIYSDMNDKPTKMRSHPVFKQADVNMRIPKKAEDDVQSCSLSIYSQSQNRRHSSHSRSPTPVISKSEKTKLILDTSSKVKHQHFQHPQRNTRNDDDHYRNYHHRFQQSPRYSKYNDFRRKNKNRRYSFKSKFRYKSHAKYYRRSPKRKPVQHRRHKHQRFSDRRFDDRNGNRNNGRNIRRLHNSIKQHQFHADLKSKKSGGGSPSKKELNEKVFGKKVRNKCNMNGDGQISGIFFYILFLFCVYFLFVFIAQNIGCNG